MQGSFDQDDRFYEQMAGLKLYTYMRFIIFIINFIFILLVLYKDMYHKSSQIYKQYPCSILSLFIFLYKTRYDYF